MNVVVDDWAEGVALLGLDDGRLWTLGAEGAPVAFGAEFSSSGPGITAGGAVAQRTARTRHPRARRGGA